MHVAVLGAGTMGHGISQVSAMAGHEVRMRDVETEIVEDGLAAIESNLEGGVGRGTVTEAQAEATLERITGTPSLAEAVDSAEGIDAFLEDREPEREGR